MLVRVAMLVEGDSRQGRGKESRVLSLWQRPRNP